MTRAYVSVPRNAPVADLMTIVSNEIQVLGNMFRPSPPSLVSQDTYELFYPLIQSPESSSATRFTTTTASSADPLPITVTSLLRLGFRCRSYNVPAQAALHRVRSITLSLPTHLLYSEVLRKGYGALVVVGTSPSLLSLPEVRIELGWQFWLRPPSDPSLAPLYRLSLLG